MKRLSIILFIFGAILVIFFGLNRINLHTADIGRHIVNGKAILGGYENISKTDVLYKNTFSADFANTPFVNHHFLSGILFYLIYLVFGFKGLSLFYIFSVIISFFILALLTKSILENTPKDIKESIPTKIQSLVLSMIVLSPLVAYRTEVRPEGISFIFLSLFFYILYNTNKSEKNEKYLYILPILSLVWVNTHIYFVFGLFFLFVFFIESILNKNSRLAKKLFLIGFLSSILSILNPNHIKGLLYPLKIFQNYGYKIVENQSISFLENLNFNQPIFLWYKICLLIFLSYLIYFSFKRKFYFSINIIGIVFAILGFLSIRYIPLFGLFALVPFTFLIDDLSNRIKNINFSYYNITYTLFFIGAIFFLYVNFQKIMPWNRDFGLGLNRNSEKLANFIKENQISGPIFNNYDIGSYLIFYLFPKEKVFVDNRPEAYSNDFFQNQYIPMQENEEVFEKIDKEKNFNSIIFYRLDYTPWAQNFLIKMTTNKNYSLVYVDEYSIVFLKNNEKNKNIIERYKNNFRVE